MQKKRSVLVACLLGALQPGLGFLYVAKPLLTLFLPLTAILIIALASWTRLVFKPYTMLVLDVLIAVGWIVSAAMSGLIAFRKKEAFLARYQRWYVYLGTFVLFSLFGYSLREHRGQWLGFDIFRLPSASMTETFLPGDFVVVDDWAYKSGRTPEVGDIIIFEFAQYAPTKFQKRVIGLPGDLVELKDGMVLINGNQLIEPYVSASQNKLTAQSNGQYRVPDNSYFVLGDNRDASRDSREEGSVPVDSISGKVEAIWFSYDVNKGIRFDRIKSVTK